MENKKKKNKADIVLTIIISILAALLVFKVVDYLELWIILAIVFVYRDRLRKENNK